MNTPSNAPESYNDPLSEFELQLGERSLGDKPARGGQLMYECGYAAGVSATRKRSARVTKGWQLVGLAASMVACMASLSHLGSWRVTDREQLGMEQLGARPSVKTEEPRSRSISEAERHQVTWERLANRPAKGMLRTTSTLLTEIEAVRVDREASSIEPTQDSVPLRPCDFSLFLKG